MMRLFADAMMEVLMGAEAALVAQMVGKSEMKGEEKRW